MTEQKTQDEIILELKIWRNHPDRLRMVRDFCRKAGITVKDRDVVRQKQIPKQELLF